MNILKSICLGISDDVSTAFTGLIAALVYFADMVSAESVICGIGLILFGIWLLRTSWGRKALTDSRPRPNNMPPYLPLLALLVWFAAVPIVLWPIGKLIGDLPDWQSEGLKNLVYCLVGMSIAMGIMFAVKVYFPRGLKGFGLDLRTAGRDFAAACVNLLAVWPLVVTAILLTTRLGRLIWGPDFQMPRHEQLQLVGQYSQWSLRVLVFLVAAVVAPLLEEILFRGLVQTVIRSLLEKAGYSQSAWPAIAAGSALFVAAHANPAHWPGLFVLSMCMGYSYEKSGSLLRPIIIHALFNGIMVSAVLTQ
ncbi:MAG: CPBP family intramembrane metalloprotease [Sedimentisphaerales bacterium]|nr:CPBP family intramembrane metalloprotease [Sedimentisphaerales bacterium]